MSRSKWSSLQKDLLLSISDLLDTDIDLLRLRSVCTSWRSSVPPNHNKSSLMFPLRLPVWLSPQDINNNKEIPGFFNLTETTVYRFEEVNTTISWLVKVQEAEPGMMRILNPLCNCSFNHLPENFFPKILNLMNFRVSVISKSYQIQYINTESQVSFCGDYYSLNADKVAVSSTPADDCAIMAIHTAGTLSFLKAGDEIWTSMDGMGIRYEDVIYYKDKFYAVDCEGKALAFDSLFRKLELTSPFTGKCGDKKYLVESTGDLLLVDRYITDYCDPEFCTITVQFKVYKLNAKLKKWDELKKLENVALFVSDDCSFSISAREFSGIKESCLFYKEGVFWRYNSKADALKSFFSHDAGVFNLENRSHGPLASYPGHYSIFYPPPNMSTA